MDGCEAIRFSEKIFRYTLFLIIHFQSWRHGSIITNSAQGVNFKKLGHFVTDDILQNLSKRSSFLEFMPYAALVKLSLGEYTHLYVM